MKTNLELLRDFIAKEYQVDIKWVMLDSYSSYSSDIREFYDWLNRHSIPVKYQKPVIDRFYPNYACFIDTFVVEFRSTKLEDVNGINFIGFSKHIMKHCKFDNPHTYKFNIGEEVQMLMNIPYSHSNDPTISPGIHSSDFGVKEIIERQTANGGPWYKLKGYGNWCKENSLEAVVKKEIPMKYQFKIGDRVINMQEDSENSCRYIYRQGDSGIITDLTYPSCPSIKWDNGKIGKQYTKHLQLVPHLLSDIQPFTTPSVSICDSTDALVHSAYALETLVVATPQPKNDILEGPVLITKKSKKKGKLMSL